MERTGAAGRSAAPCRQGQENKVNEHVHETAPAHSRGGDGERQNLRHQRNAWIYPEKGNALLYRRYLVFQPKKGRIRQLGLGTGALTKFCYRNFPQSLVTAVELNPAVITICRSMLKLPPDDDRLLALEMDAMDFVTDSANHGTLDVLQADLYDATVKGPVMDTPEFYEACAACLTPQGIMTVNLFGEHPSYAKNFNAMRYAFKDVICLPPVHEGACCGSM